MSSRWDNFNGREREVILDALGAAVDTTDPDPEMQEWVRDAYALLQELGQWPDTEDPSG